MKIRDAIFGLALALPLAAQSDMRGHWSGPLDTPAGTMNFEFDLDKPQGGWIGSMAIPVQGASGVPLDRITFSEGKGVFYFKGAPGDPHFTGTLSAYGKTLDGTFQQGPTSLPLKLTRTGEAKVELPKASPPVGTEFVGTWQGTINAGPGLRISLTISNGKSGAEAAMVSLDQGNAQIPVSAITQTGTKISLEVKAVGGGYEGEISKDGSTLEGTWTQLGNGVALQFKKAAK